MELPSIQASDRHRVLSRGVRRKRSGAVVLEILLALPFVLIALLAIIEFGLLWSNMQGVEMAARSGAQVATRFPTLPNGGNVPADVLDAVADELARIGVTDFRVQLTHNVAYTPNPAIGPVVTLDSAVGSGLSSVPSPPAVSLSPNRMYVQITVFVNTVGGSSPTGLAPNLLKVFGVDLENRVSQASEVRRYAY
jgi:Flp pilus assembly protein TadG